MAEIRKYVFPEAMWAGTDHSLLVAMDVHDAMMAGLFDQSAVQSAATDPAEAPPGFSLQGNVGIVTVRGPLVNTDSWLNVYRGVTSYNSIRTAMIYAANNSAVKAILMDIDSGGGSVSGVADAGNLISSIDKGVKPVYAFSDGQMASAAYWLGVSTRGVYASATSTLGSIGVIATHKEYSQAFKEAGIGVTVMRSGEFKALANSMEPLTATAVTQLQGQLDAAYSVFANHVSTQLGVNVDAFDKTMGQGREFFGVQAVTAGLAKGVKTFDSMLAFVNKQIDSSANREQTVGNYQQGTTMTRAALTPAQIAAAAAGITLEAELTPAEIAAATVAAEAAAATAAAAAALAASNAAAAAAVVVTPAAEAAALTTYLQGQVKDLNASLLAQSIELNAAKALNDTMKAAHAGLMKIVAGTVSTMKIGLGHAKADFSAMSADLLIAEHAATETLFKAKFKVGGVAGATPIVQRDEAVVPDAERAARIAATQFPSKK